MAFDGARRLDPKNPALRVGGQAEGELNRDSLGAAGPLGRRQRCAKQNFLEEDAAPRARFDLARLLAPGNWIHDHR